MNACWMCPEQKGRSAKTRSSLMLPLLGAEEEAEEVGRGVPWQGLESVLGFPQAPF